MDMNKLFVFSIIITITVTTVNGAFEGGFIQPPGMTLKQWDSPFYIKDDITVMTGAVLKIEPGVRMNFFPQVMLAVNGTLEAKGTTMNPIVMTVDLGQSDPEPDWPSDIRLVDDRSVSYGRLQVLYQGSWRGVCANAINWTEADTTVACRQLGFDHGNFTFFSWATNDSMFMLYYKPGCNGGEKSVLDCPNSNNIKIGSRICKHQQTIHLDCYGLAPDSPAHNYWWGLEFYNSTITEKREEAYLIKVNESSSVLENVIVEYSGVDPTGHPVPAIRASPYVPFLINVTLRHCALDATNFSSVLTSTIVNNSRILNNRGHGVVVETHLGRVSITNSDISNNHGNGIKAKFLNGNFLVLDEKRTFCELRSNAPGARMYLPELVTAIPTLHAMSPCERLYETMPGRRVTLSVLEMDIEPGATGTIEVYDYYNSDPAYLIASYPIINGTLPQGITSRLQYLYVRFLWTMPPGHGNGDCTILKDCVKATLLIDAAQYSKEEFYLNNSRISNNTQHGIFAENIRNFFQVNASVITHNQYGAGLRVFGGAGDIHVNASKLEHNQNNGVNITYNGGWRIFNVSSFSYNYGNGLNITLNDTKVDNKTRYSRAQRTEVSRSSFNFNDGFGMRVSNSCREGKVVVNDSTFIHNNWDGIEVECCFRIIPQNNVTNFTLVNNTFDGNYGHGVRVSPMINMVGRMTNNTFRNHPRHTFLIDNTDDFLKELYYSPMKVEYEVIENDFENNEGFYVIHLRLTHNSSYQTLNFKYNRIRYNRIKGAFPTINARTRAYGVVILSSDNVIFKRNHMENPESTYEIATHLLDISSSMHAREVWWGHIDYQKITNSLFDQWRRFDLPKILYHPTLRSSHLYGNNLNNDEDNEFEPPFVRGDRLGGKLTSSFTTTPGKTYRVDRDISIISEKATGELHISAGTVLEVENSIGILVQGLLSTRDTSSENPVMIKLLNESTYVNSTIVRLVDGPSELEGRLEIMPEGEDVWGTLCNEGWNIESASVACQMMGFVVHPDDWGFYDATTGDSWQPIWRSSVRCTDLDMDVTRCEADHVSDHSCNHTQDVYLRCKIPTWGGIHFLAKARSGKLSHVTITEAGLMDPSLIIYAPALRIDYNTHTLEYLKVINNVHDGIEIMKNDIYANVALRHSLITQNHGNGVSIRGSFFELYNCQIVDNRKSGFEYNPHYTTYEARQIRNGIHEPIYFINVPNAQLTLGDDTREFVATGGFTLPGRMTYFLEVTVNQFYHIVLDLIDYTPDIMWENVTIFDGPKSSIDSPSIRKWKIEDDLPDFPIQSQDKSITIMWEVNRVSSGRFAFVLHSKAAHLPWPFPELHVKNVTTQRNEHGIITRHYNQPSNEYQDLFFRYRWETITMFGVDFRDNYLEALHVPSITKYHDLYLPTFEELQNQFKIAEITYEIDSCHFIHNGACVVAEHNHVEFSNNIWIWQVTNNHFEENYSGGFLIELPKVNLMYSELYNHSVDINDTVFENNQNFEFRIDGFYCNSSIARNRFQNNVCKSGCITITGTEKDFEMHENEIVENAGKYIFEINMHSHTPYTRWVDAQIVYNNFKRNRKLDGTDPAPTSTPTTYTVGIKGLQNITMNRNLFANYLDFELVGGYTSSSLENYLDATENWWGTIDQVKIQSLIFDFDDWNSYAKAEYYPHLLGDHYDSPSSSQGKYVPVFDPTKPLGGIITGSLRLPTRAEPYIVNRDLTIMPTGSVVIEEGVQIQFYPNVGMLVLGSLSTLGTKDQRVKFMPINKNDYETNARRTKRRAEGGVRNLHDGRDKNVSPMMVRLSGGANSDEGFIEIYNQTERRWAIICDSNFNERTAEVACKTMGKESSNAIVKRSTLYDHYVWGYHKMHEQLIEWFWRETFICDGTEPDLETCRYKINYNLYSCMEARDYVFMRCGPRNLAPEYEYWGNLRFSSSGFEDSNIQPGFSRLDYLDIYGAGILHGEKNAAIQTVHRSPSTRYIRITHCNSNGYDYIAPKSEFEIRYNEISSNNGYAFGGLVLNGDSNYENTQSSFYPLVESTIPYDVFGLVRMCTSEKLIHVKTRLLLYFKYRFETIDCIKIIRSKEPNRRIALRLLQFNLYNDTFYENALEMYNGEFFSQDMLIKKLDVKTNHDNVAKRKPYQTLPGYDTMGIRITASAAYGDMGFIADIVTLPYSGGGLPGLDVGLRQRIANNLITHNEGGGFHFANVGENNPAVIIELNRIQWNGLRMLNLTSEHIIDMFIQNSRLATIANNYIVNNGGGLKINSTTTSASDGVYFNITNNIINYNTHGESMHIEGHHYNRFEVQNNYIAYNEVGERNVVAMFGIRLNYTSNIIFNNTGQCILNGSVPEQIDINHNYRRNSFHNNHAIAANKSTVFLRSAKFLFENNFFQNPHNIYDMVMYNRTKYPDGTYPEVRAQFNWWGSGQEAYVGGRIWDRKDDDNLIGVTYLPAHTSNQSVIEGRCYPGWRLLEEKCYLYFGGVLPYRDAELECKAHRARIGWARDKNYERMFGEIINSMQINYNELWETWAYSEWQREGKCTVLRNYEIEHIDCSTHIPFLCERDPYINPTIYWWPIRVACGVSGAVLFIALIFGIFGIIKARHRKYERLQRRTDIRRSVHSSRVSVYSNRGARSTAGARSIAESFAKRRRPQPSASMDFINLSGATLDDTSDSIDKAKMDFRRPSTPHSALDQSSSKLDQSSYMDSDLSNVRPQFDYFSPPLLENEIRSVRQPGPDRFDNAMFYKNDAYDDDRSVDMNRARSASSMAGPSHRVPRDPYESTSQYSQRSRQDVYQHDPYRQGSRPYDQSYSPASHDQSWGQSDANLARSIRDKPPRPRPKESAM